MLGMNLRERMSGWRGAAALAAVTGLLGGVIALAVLFAGPTLNLGAGVGPGRDSVGVITIPPTFITSNTVRLIQRHLDYARRDERIKAVVINLSSPGGSAAGSERLYLETRNLREEMPVVFTMHEIVASGGYMMAMGGNYSYAQPSSLVGNVGIIVGGVPILPFPPSERTIGSGPEKLSGASRQDWFEITDLLKKSFVQIVVDERGERLRASPEEIATGRLYSGVEAVHYGLADAIGSDSDAIEKAAELAGLSHYDVVDVNLAVLLEALRALRAEQADPALPLGEGSDFLSSLPNEEYAWPSLLTEMAAGETLPGFPADAQRPELYYYYAGSGIYEPAGR